MPAVLAILRLSLTVTAGDVALSVTVPEPLASSPHTAAAKELLPFAVTVTAPEVLVLRVEPTPRYGAVMLSFASLLTSAMYAMPLPVPPTTSF